MVHVSEVITDQKFIAAQYNSKDCYVNSSKFQIPPASKMLIDIKPVITYMLETILEG
jgi:hypothetical protein